MTMYFHFSAPRFCHCCHTYVKSLLLYIIYTAQYMMLRTELYPPPKNKKKTTPNHVIIISGELHLLCKSRFLSGKDVI